MVREQVEAGAEVVAKTANYGGGASAVVLMGMSAGELSALVAASVAVLGFLSQLYFTGRREYRERAREQREREEHSAKMAQLLAEQQGAGDEPATAES